MPLSKRQTLTQYLIEQRRRFPGASGDLNALVLDVSIVCKAIARAVAFGELAESNGISGPAGGTLNVQGEVQKRLDVIGNEMFVRQCEWSGHLAGMASEEMDQPYQIPTAYSRGKYLLVFDPLDGSSNIDVNVSVGSIFSILRAPPEAVESGRDVTEADFLQPGAAQVAAGYALYGPVTMLVLSVGNGVVGFTLPRVEHALAPGLVLGLSVSSAMSIASAIASGMISLTGIVVGFALGHSLGGFKLTHRDIRVPEDTQEFAINTSNSRFWEPPVKRYVDECLAGRAGVRGKDFNMRWIASMVAEAHRILMRGGVFMYPRDTKDPAKPGRLRLLYEANPIGFVMEQAGGRASTGRQPVLGVKPSALHQRIGLVFGSKNEVERIERYHHEPAACNDVAPLFAERSLFRD